MAKLKTPVSWHSVHCAQWPQSCVGPASPPGSTLENPPLDFAKTNFAMWCPYFWHVKQWPIPKVKFRAVQCSVPAPCATAWSCTPRDVNTWPAKVAITSSVLFALSPLWSALKIRIYTSLHTVLNPEQAGRFSTNRQTSLFLYISWSGNVSGSTILLTHIRYHSSGKQNPFWEIDNIWLDFVSVLFMHLRGLPMFCIYTNMSFLPLSFQSFLSIKKNTLGKGGGGALNIIVLFLCLL